MYFRLTLSLLLLSAGALRGQITEGGFPFSLSLSLNTPAPVLLPALDLEAARAEDAARPEQQRFAAPVPADVSPASQGEWSDVPGGRIWRCALQAPNGGGMVLLFDRFSLPQGARFFAFTPGGDQVWGAFTAKSGTSSGKFLIGPVPGREVILELFVSDKTTEPADVHLNRVDVAYDVSVAGLLGFDDALPCHVNVNCPEGADWQTEKKGVARILMVFSNGAGWCTGTLIANADGTKEPYFLSAHHCQLIGLNPDFSMWRFDFDYESATCANPTTEPIRRSVLGCQRISFREETDFMLLKMNAIPANYNLYFNGWTRSTTPPASTTHIHHPVGDIKKITHDNQAPTVYPQLIDWGGVFGISPVNTHWSVIPEVGVYQPGSSGCPLFDPNKRIIGQLHGGNADPQDNCIIINSFFGRFDLSWDQGTTPASRLKDWLDPGNTNKNTVDGYPQNSDISISGEIRTHGDKLMPNVRVYLSGGRTDSTLTDAQGAYTFLQVPAGQSYTITPAYTGNANNGVTAFDISLYTRHILGAQQLDTPWKIISGDVNDSKSVTSFDMVDIRKVVLGASVKFAAAPIWRFFPASTTFADPFNPFSSPLPAESITVTNLQQSLTDADFIGVKVGDANANANPGQ